MSIHSVDSAVLKERAVRLFDFLIKAQKVRSKPHRTLDTYVEQGGKFIFFASLPASNAIGGAFTERDPEPRRPFLVLDRVPRTSPPEPGQPLKPWLDKGWEDDPTNEPVLLQETSVWTEKDDALPTVMHLDAQPEIERCFEDWLPEWRSWAEVQKVRAYYTQVFQISERVANAPEELELVIGVGTLSWRPDSHEEVKRPVVVLPVTIDFEDSDGRITVRESDTSRGPILELDMLDTSLWPEPSKRSRLSEEIQAYEDNLLSRDSMGEILRRIAHNLGSEGQYFDEKLPLPAGTEPAICFAPVLMLRRRSNESLIRVFSEIRSQLESASSPPQGIAQLVAVLESSIEEGSGVSPVEVDGETYLPLHANKEQLRIVERVDTRPYVVVQGPPGTGKTHTIANIVSHLLAQGKKVLVTAQTDRALRELRAKLPKSLEALCVSAVGREQSDLTDLKVAVNELTARAENFDPVRAREHIDQLEKRLDGLRRKNAEIKSRLITRRETEVVDYELGLYRGSLSEIAKAHRKDAERYSWLEDLSPSLTKVAPPLDNAEALELLRLLKDSRLEEHPSGGELVDPQDLPDPDVFDQLCSELAESLHELEGFTASQEHPAFRAIATLSAAERSELRNRVQALVKEAGRLASRKEAWMGKALNDIALNKPGIWKHRRVEIERHLDSVKQLVDQLGVNPRIQMSGGLADASLLISQAEELRQHLASGGRLKTVLKTPRALKQAETLMKIVTVEGRRPDTVELLGRFIVWAKANQALEDVEKLWPADVPIPEEDTLAERWAWNRAEVEILGSVTALAERIHEMESALSAKGIPHPDWFRAARIQEFEDVISAGDAAEGTRRAKAPLEHLASTITRSLRSAETDPVHNHLAEAVRSLDPFAYREAHVRLQHLHDIKTSIERRERLLQKLREFIPEFNAGVLKEARDGWQERMATFEQAWMWCLVGHWIDEESATDDEGVQAQADVFERKALEALADLTAAKAWESSVERLGSQQRQSLKGYALAVKKLGKGTGKYAEHKRTVAQSALQDCREAVPAWVMPIYRIAETLSISSDIFDVVIIDEASQAGLEAAFLQYLAPKVVVVGDDKQVSPAGVGIDQQHLINLRRQYLYDFPQGHLWESPQTSFFDVANLKYGDVITLREHFRCVPEIIGFSNRIAYEPEGVALIPLRQYGTDRLEPIKTEYVSNGYSQGSSGNRVNKPEAEAIVDAVTKCLADRAYDGKTMGIISLTGWSQALKIEQELLARVDIREIRARELRCGDAPDFQGSERDVIFLSMVATRDGNFAPLTSDLYLQRFNVAASRAKDQMWLFHSVLPSDLANRNDLRLKLLEYCLAEKASADQELQQSAAVPDHERVEPFDSLFEQRVYNDLCRRRFNVVPQWGVYGYRIDLVVVGGKSRLAIECDGDQWHGADAYEQDLDRQRELERCGWTFFRLRASTYYRDPTAALEPLWGLLDNLDIRPTGWTSPAPEKAAEPPADINAEEVSPMWPRESVARESDDEIPSPGVPMKVSTTHVGEDFLSGHEPQPISAAEARIERGSNPATTSEVLFNVSPELESQKPFSSLGGLDAYRQWDTNIVLPNPTSISTTSRINALTQIVRVEGPVLTERVFSLFVGSAGMSKVGKNIKHALNTALTSALRQGIIVGDNPLHEAGNVPLTLRLPEQPQVNVRTIGPRTFHEVPPAEVATLIQRIRNEYRFDGDEEVCRRVLRIYGLKKVTNKTWERFLQTNRLAADG